MTLHELLVGAASSAQDRRALVDGDRSFTYLELLRAAEAMRRRLDAAGLGPGETAALKVPNSPEYAAALLACISLGARTLLLDPSLKVQETESYCERAAAGLLLHRADAKENVEDGRLPSCVVPPMEALSGEGQGSAAMDRAPGAEDEESGFLLLSSGTTGVPKIVWRTAAQTEAALTIFSETIPHTEDDKVLAALPFVHSFGLLNVLLSSLAAGAALHLVQFSPRTAARVIEQQAITVLPATPFMFRLLTETDFSRKPDFSSVRLAVSAGSALAPAVARGFREKLSVDIVQSYGTTETGPVALARHGDAPQKPGWVGKAYSRVAVEVWDASDAPLPRGSDGVIAVTSPACASCYLFDPEASAGTFRSGRVLTGDVGHQSTEGDLFVLGRQRPMLNVFGKKVSPAEVEACLRAHPRVADVLVHGVKTPTGEERIGALIVRSGHVSAAELREFCTARLADFKAPRSIEFVKNLSQGPMGKARTSLPGHEDRETPR
jgi:long-chain acyl-CoA synthetase